MSGSVTPQHQPMPVMAATNVVVGAIAGTGTAGKDGAEAAYCFLLDETDPGAVVPLKGISQDGTDSTDSNATQATAGVGIRGWLSTLVSLFRSGLAKVTVSGTVFSREVSSTSGNYGQVPVTNTATLIRSATSTRNVCTIRNVSGAAGQDLWFGSNTLVTPSTGFLMRASSFDGYDIKWTGAIYAISSTGTGTVAFWEEIL